MKKELDKEMYPDYVYPEFTPDPNEPFREPALKRSPEMIRSIGDWPECFPMRKQNWQ